jgi:hypothetical protein
MYDGVPYPSIGLNAVAGKDRRDFGLDPTSYDTMRPGCYTVEDRIADMDLDGIHAQLCFPSFPGFAGSTFFGAKDKELAAACVRAWNDWMIDEWCAGMPGRQIPLALVPYWDIDATVAEAERIIGRGARSISFTEMPHALGLPSFHTDHWDRFLAVVSEAEVPLSLHFGSGGAPSVAPEAPFTAAIALYGQDHDRSGQHPVVRAVPQAEGGHVRRWHRVDALPDRAGRLHLGAAPVLHRDGRRPPAF